VADTLSAAELASRYGWAAAVLNSDPELAALLQSATAAQWTPERFTAELRSTKWFQQRSETARQMTALQQSDPATYKQRLDALTANVTRQAAGMGVVLDDAGLQSITNHFLMYGYNEAQIASALSGYVKYRGDSLTGQAGQLEDQFRQFAYANGVRVDDTWVLKAAQNVVAGKAAPDAYMDEIRGWAVSAFPTLAEQLKAGMTVAEVASPYRQSMAALLETPPDKIDVFDPSIRKALTGVDQAGQPAVTPLWKFEQEVRKDPRWMKTNNARESLVSSTRQILNDFGFAQ
jgi:hypothetical protein